MRRTSQMRTSVWPDPPLARHTPPCRNTTAVTEAGPPEASTRRPVGRGWCLSRSCASGGTPSSVLRATGAGGARVSQTITAPSRAQEATAHGQPSVVATLFTLPAWPRRVARQLRLRRSHTFSRWSPPALTSCVSPAAQARSNTALWCASHCARGTRSKRGTQPAGSCTPRLRVSRAGGGKPAGGGPRLAVGVHDRQVALLVRHRRQVLVGWQLREA